MANPSKEAPMPPVTRTPEFTAQWLTTPAGRQAAPALKDNP